MTKRNRWLKKQARKIQGLRGYVPKRIRARREAYAKAMAKYISERSIIPPFPHLIIELRNYASGKQNVKEYKKAFGL